MSITQSIETLKAMRAKIASLETQVGSEIRAELASLPQKYGFASAEAFVAAVQEAIGAGPKKRGRPKGSGLGKPAKVKTGKRTRAKITPEMRAEVVKLAKAGKTAVVIAKAVGISLPSVQNIKKAAGLVKARN